jgi:hypothetical protein
LTSIEATKRRGDAALRHRRTNGTIRTARALAPFGLRSGAIEQRNKRRTVDVVPSGDCRAQRRRHRSRLRLLFSPLLTVTKTTSIHKYVNNKPAILDVQNYAKKKTTVKHIRHDKFQNSYYLNEELIDVA